MLQMLRSHDFPLSKEFSEQVETFKKDWKRVYEDISKETTPKLDGNGKEVVKNKGDTGYKYIIDSYMHDCLDKHFPGWSWEMAAPLQFLGAEWVVAQGNLKIIDEHLLAFGIIPPYRTYYGVDAVRVQYPKNQQHVVENIIDIGDNCKQANTNAMKAAINRLTHIGDDIYGRVIENEGAGSLEDIIISGSDKAKDAFYKYIDSKHWLWSKVKEVLKAKANIELTEIKDFGAAKELLDKEMGQK